MGLIQVDVVPGVSWRREYLVFDVENDVVDISDASLKMQVRDRESGDLIVEVSSPNDGITIEEVSTDYNDQAYTDIGFIVTLAPAQTQAIADVTCLAEADIQLTFLDETIVPKLIELLFVVVDTITEPT